MSGRVFFQNNTQNRGRRMGHFLFPTRMPAFVLASFCLVLNVGIPFASVSAAEKIKGRLIVEDIMARPGTSVTLEALLIEEGILGAKGLGGEIVAFVVQGRHAGTALTGGDGRAFLEFKTRMRGNHPVVAAVETSSRVESVEGTGNLASWERRRPILLVDVATLFQHDDSVVKSLPDLPLPDIPLPNLPFAESLMAFGSPREHARQTLFQLAEFYYNVLYVHHRRDTALHETRAWLRQHQFPVGIAKTVPQNSKALLALMEELKENGWDNLDAGIGRTWDFAQTLVKQRLKTVVFPDPTEQRKYPHRAKVVQTWKDVQQHL